MKTNPYFLRQFLLLLQTFGNMHCYFSFASKVSHKVFLSFYFSFFLFFKKTEMHLQAWILMKFVNFANSIASQTAISCFECRAGGSRGSGGATQILKQNMFYQFYGNSMNNLLSYCGLIDPRASEKDLSVI